MSIDKTTLETRKITKIDGLNDVKISGLSFDKVTDKLIVTYDNTKIDILTDGKIRGVNDLFEKTILGDKTIYDIYLLLTFTLLILASSLRSKTTVPMSQQTPTKTNRVDYG